MNCRVPKSARLAAMTVLNRFNQNRDYAGPILNEILPQTKDKQKATDLVFGSIRNAKAIDMVIAKFADCPVERIPVELLNIIHIGAYELIYCHQTAEYAIVNEAVENARKIAGEKQTAFVNAVLRQITRHIQNRQIPLSQAAAAMTLPQTTSTGCEFDTAILPDPKDSPADFLSNAFSLPKWLIADWLGDFGFEKTKQICFASNRRPSVYIRPNILKTTTEKLVQKLRQADVDSEAIEGTMIKLKSPKAVSELPGFAEGLFTVQDITAARPVRLLKPQPHWTILDLCAAPGTKTTQLAEATGDSAKIIATDIDAERLKKGKESTARLGINSVTVVAYENLEKVIAELGPFDCVLLDVPCSNTGVLAKRPEVRLRIKPKAIAELTKIQKDLLQKTIKIIKPNGKICYSTCSIQRQENNDVMKEFLKENQNFKLEAKKLTLPSAKLPDHDGGYVAVIKRV